MNLTFILFCISLLGLLIMFAIRSHELKSNRHIFPNVCRTWADNIISKTGFAIWRIIARIKKLAVERLVVIPHKISLFLALVWSKFRGKVDKYFDRFHRHNISSGTGPMSSYWKSMHDHKDSLPKDGVERDDVSRRL